MPRKHNPKPPYPAQFRQQMIELVAAGRRPSELAKEFGCHETSILSWMNRFRRILVRWEKLPKTFIAMLHLTCGIITWLATDLLE